MLTPELLRSEEFRYVLRGWRDEMPAPVGILEHPYMDLRTWQDRIIEQRFILWMPAWDRDADGMFAPRLDASGRRVREHRPPCALDDPDDWILPVHEAVKRRKGRGRHVALEYRWLVAILRSTGAPCLCGHRSVVEHLASSYRVPEEQIVGAVLRACRAAVRDVRPHDYSAPQEPAVRADRRNGR